jgi:long-chain acyl-CoA synthetase
MQALWPAAAVGVRPRAGGGAAGLPRARRKRHGRVVRRRCGAPDRTRLMGGGVAGNIADFFGQHLARPGQVLYRQFADDAWRDVAAGELALDVARWQAAFRREGLAPGDRVALCVRNGVAWVAIDLAALGLQLVVVPLFVDDALGNVAWCVADAEARLLVVENARLATGLARPGAGGAPPPIVVLRGDDAHSAGAGVTPVQRFLPPHGGDVEIRSCSAGTLATICYTSGTAGRPKGVMLSHDNIIANVASCRGTGMARADDRFLSILPLSHMFERTGGYYLPLALGAQVAFARGIAHVADDLATQAPTVVFAVPRILERLKARVDRSLASSRAKRALFRACVRCGWRIARGDAAPLCRMLHLPLQALVAKPVRRKLGGRLRLAVVGGAALDPVLARTFIGLGLTVLQGYGMTEASPVISVNAEADNDPESVGPPLPGVEIKLTDGDELLVRGGNVMQGYWRNAEATRAAVDRDGWLHTGDLAEIREGRIYLRGRMKDILVLSNGEKLPPHDVELAILRDPVFEQVMLVGEGRPFLALLAVTRETDEQALVLRANNQLTSHPRWIRVRRVIATPDAWSVDNGLATPTLKLKRPRVLDRFKDRIDAIYAESPGV